MSPKDAEQIQTPPAKRRWLVLATVTVLAVGGCTMYLSWGVWGVFVVCSSVTLVGLAGPSLMLLPRPAVTPQLIMQVASCAVWFMLVGWGLVALLNPEYTVGWTFPGKSRSVRIHDADDAWLIGWLELSLGAAAAVLVITVEIIPRIRRARTKR